MKHFTPIQAAAQTAEPVPAVNDATGHCVSCGRDNSGYEGQPCADDCPMYWEEAGRSHPDHQEPVNAADRLRLRMEELDARFAPERECSARAMRIVDRVLPHLPAASAYTDRVGFASSARRKGQRDNLYRSVKARLLAKAGVRPDWWLGDEPAAQAHLMVAPR